MQGWGLWWRSHATKYLLVIHLGSKHDLATKLGKSNCSFKRHKRLKHQDHASMNACVLNNSFAKLCPNKQKVINQVKRQTTCKWGQFKSDALCISKVLKPTLVRFASSNLFILLGVLAWGVGSIPQCDGQREEIWRSCKIYSRE